jgi:uncharacterized protein
MKGLTFNVDQLPVEGVSGQRVLESSWFTLPPKVDDPVNPVQIVDPISVKFHVERSGKDVRVEVAVTTTASLTCARCLNPFLFPVNAQTNFTYCRVSNTISMERDLHLNLEDLESGTFEGDEIDLSGLVYEQIALSFPIKPLCHGDCMGLCPECGTDRNERTCDCTTERVDPRWDALRKLKLSV